ncbi:hypothetical protein Dimus_032827 [Dionaea muscipula]
MLSDTGDLTLRDYLSGGILWESFQQPCDVFLEDMLIGINTKTGQERYLSSWRSKDDPSPGNFTLGLAPLTSVQGYVWKGQAKYWSTGPWNGTSFTGVDGPVTNSYINNFVIQQNNQAGTIYVMFNQLDNSSAVSVMLKLSYFGSVTVLFLDESVNEWKVQWQIPNSTCDVYGTCGPFGVCNSKESPICICVEGFMPKSEVEWSQGNWSSGCTRRTELLCEKNTTGNLTSGRWDSDGFWKLGAMKLPDNSLYSASEDSEGCQNGCLDNCSCVAYAYVSGIGCLVWTGDLIDIQQFFFSGQDIFIKLAHSELVKRKQRVALIVSVTTALFLIVLGCIIYALYRKGAKKKGDLAQELECNAPFKKADSYEVPAFNFDKISLATNNFDGMNKLGEGGFGVVYKGKLENGQEIAVKRLSRCSGQGVGEFKNEIMLISKLQHRNLVRTLGFCIRGEEKLIIYEYMANGSLNTSLFDSTKKEQLHWDARFKVIEGIARGLLYLHRDSRLRVIHRDLKASNVLLDDDMNPKISDFGLARTFLTTQDSDSTHQVVGTLGYMPPEYALRGIFSDKTDVFAFGILLLEIISGKKNSSFSYDDLYLNLPGYAWQLWDSDRGLELMDEALTSNPYSKYEVVRCLNVGLLCVQDLSADRPTMSAVVLMLSSEASLPQPKRPTFFPQSLPSSDHRSHRGNASSVNSLSVTAVDGR